jgi:hypothetical protein
MGSSTRIIALGGENTINFGMRRLGGKVRI